MPLLDFTELTDSEGKLPLGEGLENLVRELGERLGLRPDWSGRGADRGRDLFFTERRRGPLGITELRWLVSCKDHAKSGRSVTEQDVGAIGDKLDQHGSQGFLLVTTSTASTGLKDTLDGVGKARSRLTKVWDRTELENLLLQDAHIDLVKRYLPRSYLSYNRLSGVPQALDALRAFAPASVFHKIEAVVEAYQVGHTWLTGEKIWPDDPASVATIDRALSALLEKNDAITAAKILSREEIEFDAFDSTLRMLFSVRPAQTGELCRALVEDGNNKGSAIYAFQFFVQHFEPDNEEQIRLAGNLDPEDLLDLYSAEVEAFIIDEVMGNPERYSAWSDLDALASSVSVAECNVERLAFCADVANAKIEFTAKLEVSVELTFAREHAGSHTCPGTLSGYIDPFGMYIEKFEVDTSNYY